MTSAQNKKRQLDSFDSGQVSINNNVGLGYPGDDLEYMDSLFQQSRMSNGTATANKNNNFTTTLMPETTCAPPQYVTKNPESIDQQNLTDKSP